MNPQIEKLSRMLNLSPYQAQTLVGGSDKYNMSRLVSAVGCCMRHIICVACLGGRLIFYEGGGLI